MSSPFGEIVTPPQIEAAVLATLQNWSPTYLREMERRTGRAFEALPDVASWRPADDIMDRFPEQLIPAVQLQITSEIELQRRAQDVLAFCRGTIDVVVQAAEPETARELAALYAYSLGLIVFQKSQLDGSVKCAGTVWESLGTPDTFKSKAASRWMAVGTTTIAVAVEGIASPLMGPEAPQVGETEPPAYPVAETTELDVTLED